MARGRSSPRNVRIPTPKTIHIPKAGGAIGGKSRLPSSLAGFTIEQLKGNGEKGRSLNQLREIAKNRLQPPVNRQKNPIPMPKVKNT